MPHDVVDVGTDLVVNHLLDAYCDCAATGSNVGQHQLPIHSHRSCAEVDEQQNSLRLEFEDFLKLNR